MNEPIPRGSKSIQDAIDLIEAMGQDGDHGLVFVTPDMLDFGPRSEFMYHISHGGIRFNLPCFIWEFWVPFEAVSEELVRHLWLMAKAAWETKHQRKWNGPGA